MSQGSRYYNLDRVEPGWTREEQQFAVLTLESLSAAQLRRLLDRFEIDFGEGNLTVDEENMIGALLTDTTKDALLIALRSEHPAP